MKHLILILSISFLSVFSWTACSSDNSGEEAESNQAKTESTASGLTPFEEKHGVGPVTEEITLGEIDQQLAKQGAEIFKGKCSACHKMNERYVGPQMGDILEKRSPTYVMNMMLNPDGMLEKHPEAKKMLSQFYTPMPNQNLTREQARSVVEYIRTQNGQ